MKFTLIIVLSILFTLDSYGQFILSKGPGSEVIRDCNVIYNKPRGWKFLDTTFNDQPLVHHFLYQVIARSGIYNPKKNIYMILGGQPIRSSPRHISDSSANNLYLTRAYTTPDLVPLQEDIVSSAMLKEANVDNVVSYKVKLDTPFLGKYHYAKQFLLHKQDVANVTLNFIGLNKRKEKEIDTAFKEMWGMIRFRPDSAYHPIYLRGALVGKFRNLRPQLNTRDSLKNVKNRKRMYFVGAMFNGKSALKAKKVKQARKNFLVASRILPDNASPIKSLLRMYLDRNQLDSALVYLKKLRKDYLLQNPKLLSEIKYGWAIWYEKKGRYDSAIVVNKQLLKLRPQNAVNIYLGIAENYRKMGKYETAIKKYEKVQQLNQQAGHPNNDYCTFQIGYCYEKLSDKKQAKKYFKKAEEKGYNLPEDVKEEYGL